jgi:hypothetical protein
MGMSRGWRSPLAFCLGWQVFREKAATIGALRYLLLQVTYVLFVAGGHPTLPIPAALATAPSILPASMLSASPAPFPYAPRIASIPAAPRRGAGNVRLFHGSAGTNLGGAGCHTSMQQVAGHKVRVVHRFIREREPNHCGKMAGDGSLDRVSTLRLSSMVQTHLRHAPRPRQFILASSTPACFGGREESPCRMVVL